MRSSGAAHFSITVLGNGTYRHSIFVPVGRNGTKTSPFFVVFLTATVHVNHLLTFNKNTTVAVNKKLTLCFSSTAVERFVVFNKTNWKRSHYYSIYSIVRVRNEGHDLLTASENVEALIKTDHNRFLF